MFKNIKNVFTLIAELLMFLFARKYFVFALSCYVPGVLQKEKKITLIAHDKSPLNDHQN